MAKKSGLGRGLESLIGGADGEVSAITPDSVLDLNKIKVNKNQPRKHFDEDLLAELTDSIKQNGILQPLLVRKKGDYYEIVAGERRFQAAKKAGLSEVPVIIRNIDDKEVFKLALIENLQRSDLNPIEEAYGYRKLINENGYTQEELGKVLSKSRSAIANTLRLLDLPTDVQDLMSEGKLSAGHARAILAVPSMDGRIRLADKVISENLSVRQTEKLAPIYSITKDDQNTTKRVQPQYFKRAARQLRLALNSNVKLKTVRNKNKIEIEFKDEEDLLRILGSMNLTSGQENENA